MTDAAPPGWYLDPGDEVAERWWTGVEWTEQVRPVLFVGAAPTEPPMMVDESQEAFPPESLVWIPSLQSAGRVVEIISGGAVGRLVKVNGIIVRLETAQLMPLEVDEPDPSRLGESDAEPEPTITTLLQRIVGLERQIDQIGRSLRAVGIAAWVIVAQFALAVLVVIARGRN